MRFSSPFPFVLRYLEYATSLCISFAVSLIVSETLTSPFGPGPFSLRFFALFSGTSLVDVVVCAFDVEFKTVLEVIECADGDRLRAYEDYWKRHGS